MALLVLSFFLRKSAQSAILSQFYSKGIITNILHFRYKDLFTEGKVQKALKCCQDYLGKLEELKITFPHRNYEVAAIALCSCLWALATKSNSQPLNVMTA